MDESGGGLALGYGGAQAGLEGEDTVNCQERSPGADRVGSSLRQSGSWHALEQSADSLLGNDVCWGMMGLHGQVTLMVGLLTSEGLGPPLIDTI